MADNSHRTQIIVPIIGVIGALGAAIVTNWTTLFPRDRMFHNDQRFLLEDPLDFPPRRKLRKEVLSCQVLLVHG
jgi:hypothetical protein